MYIQRLPRTDCVVDDGWLAFAKVAILWLSLCCQDITVVAKFLNQACTHSQPRGHAWFPEIVSEKCVCLYVCLLIHLFVFVLDHVSKCLKW